MKLYNLVDSIENYLTDIEDQFLSAKKLTGREIKNILKDDHMTVLVDGEKEISWDLNDFKHYTYIGTSDIVHKYFDEICQVNLYLFSFKSEE